MDFSDLFTLPWSEPTPTEGGGEEGEAPEVPLAVRSVIAILFVVDVLLFLLIGSKCLVKRGQGVQILWLFSGIL